MRLHSVPCEALPGLPHILNDMTLTGLWGHSFMLATACLLLDHKGALPGPTSGSLWPLLGILRGLAMASTVQEAGKEALG